MNLSSLMLGFLSQAVPGDYLLSDEGLFLKQSPEFVYFQGLGFFFKQFQEFFYSQVLPHEVLEVCLQYFQIWYSSSSSSRCLSALRFFLKHVQEFVYTQVRYSSSSSSRSLSALR
jgi:hypothetical protein